MPEFRGEGPGARTRDGCSVELYLRLPYGGEVELIEPWIPGGGSVLELGCGVGRVTRRLLERGYRVTAVDNSPDMLAHVPRDAATICSNIEDLALGTEFDAVIMASALINVPSADERAALLAACRRHLRPTGTFFFERYDPARLASASVGPVGSIGDIEVHIDRLERHSSHFEMTLRYRNGADEWRQHFSGSPLDDEQVREVLAEAGFAAPSWINRKWGRAGQDK